jgi:hypothetical protein
MLLIVKENVIKYWKKIDELSTKVITLLLEALTFDFETKNILLSFNKTTMCLQNCLENVNFRFHFHQM